MARARRARRATALVALAAVGCADVPSAGAPPGEERRVQVTRVVDGDTLKAGRETVRLLGIDTPESGRPDTPVECGSMQAATALRRLVEGREVVLRTDPTQDATDRFGRTLAYVDVGGRDAGETMIASGWAKPYVYRGHEFDRVDDYRAAERSARERRAGVHAACRGDFHRAA